MTRQQAQYLTLLHPLKSNSFHGFTQKADIIILIHSKQVKDKCLLKGVSQLGLNGAEL